MAFPAVFLLRIRDSGVSENMGGREGGEGEQAVIHVITIWDAIALAGAPWLARPPRPGPCLDFGFQYTIIRNNWPKEICGRILGLAWLKFVVAPLGPFCSLSVPSALDLIEWQTADALFSRAAS